MTTRAPRPQDSALTLAIEVSNPSAHGAPTTPTPDAVGPSVALARGPLLLDQEPLHTPDARHDDDLMPAIDRLFRRAGVTPADLRLVAVSIGPGGFTGLRVAVATAKALGEGIAARGHPAACCIPVPSAHVVAATFLGDSRHAGGASPAAFAVALASKRDNVWLTLFDAMGNAIPLDPGDGRITGVLATADDLEGLHRVHAFGALLADRFLPDEHRARAAALGLKIEPPVFSAAACARVAVGIAPINPAALLPLYPREPEAVTKWRVLHPEARQ